MLVGAAEKVSTTSAPELGGAGGKKTQFWDTVTVVPPVAFIKGRPTRWAFSSTVPPKVR
jgi:hypothetical protein